MTRTCEVDGCDTQATATLHGTDDDGARCLDCLRHDLGL